MHFRTALLCLVALGCKKPTPPPAIDIESALHGTRPSAPVPVLSAFGATNHGGSKRTASDLVGQPTVMWFFPAAKTGGCTVEGCGYRERFADFEALGIQIVGVSFTDVQTNAEWVADQSFQYEIWHDDSKALAIYYDAAENHSTQYPKRRTRILDASGAVVLEYNDKIIVGAHPNEVLEDARLLFPPAQR